MHHKWFELSLTFHINDKQKNGLNLTIRYYECWINVKISQWIFIIDPQSKLFKVNNKDTGEMSIEFIQCKQHLNKQI